MKYYNKVSGSEAKHLLNSDTGLIENGSPTQQNSYNVSKEIFNALNNSGVIVEDPSFDYSRKSNDGSAYVLSADAKLTLGSSVLWLIGEEFNGVKNKFIGSVNGSNGKFQLYRKVYNTIIQNANKDENDNLAKQYEWFVKLYDKNLAGNELVFEIKDSDNKKELVIDVKFNSVPSTTLNNLDEDELQTDPDQVEVELFKNLDNYPHNRIVFGAPGTGKSNKLKQDSKELLKDGGSLERVTFYPDYSYSQFVGTYKPVTDSSGEISYKFVPGPFMRVYVEAIKNPDKPYLLLIEEINRAKVASVFGDVFQLLDRDEEGFSEYDIQTSEDVKKYLIEELGADIASCDKMRIPSNMFIWATMNSADQGVFPMDTAFKRRWNFEYLGINENEDKLECGSITLGKGETAKEINWNQLRRAINEKLATDYKLNEDKLMGPFFLSKSVTKGENNDKFIDAFKNKVIMYLYEDAAKQHKSKLFSGCDSTKYSSVCHAFDEKGIRIFGEDFIALYEQQEG